MTIIPVEHVVSPGLAKEIEALKFHRNDPNDPIKKDIFEWMLIFPETLCGMELSEQIGRFPEKQKILDIGCGPGFTSLYLAQCGHSVYALEPSPLDCEVLSQNAKKMGLPITIYQSTAESIDKVPEGGFDLCIFNSSFHHCDDPLKALQNCFFKLREGGKILLINEPILKFHRSKKWFYEALDRIPEKMGHYGGNEHIYYHWEYRNLLSQSKFIEVKEFMNTRFANPRLYIQNIISKKINGVYLNGENKILLKFAILVLIKQLFRIAPIAWIMTLILKKLSLLQFHFEASKPYS